MQNGRLACLAMIVATGALLHAGSARAAGPNSKNTVKTYVCSSDGSLIIPAGAPPVATAVQARGTIWMTGTNLGSLTSGQLILSVVDPNPSAPKPGAATVESCYYNSDAITYGGPPSAALGRFWTFTATFKLDAADSGPDCPNPLTSSPLLLALTHFQDDKVESLEGTHFEMTTINTPDASLTFTCQRQEILPSLQVNWPE